MKVRRYIISLMAAVLLLTTGGCGAQVNKGTVISPIDISLIMENIDIAEEVAEVESTEEQDELFNWDGVYIEMLAEHDETLSEEKRAEFLNTFGFGDSKPFYIHTDDDGYPFMELFYDEERNIGCGIRYGENSYGNVICGFAFNNYEKVSWHYPDPFSVLSVYGTSGESSVTDYQEKYEYDDDGRLLHFQSTGAPTDIDWGSIPMIEVTFTYDDNGNLKEKHYNHNSTPHLPFATTYSYQYSHYDEQQRLAHTSSYITHGSLEGYYIYQDSSDTPAYYLELDHQYTSWPTFYKINEENYNWEFLNYNIEAGKETDFLSEQGFSEYKLIYEYEYSLFSHRYTLSLYCDDELTKGVGFFRQYSIGKEREDLEIFTFDGCVSYLNSAVDLYYVYSDYSNGRDVSFLHGERIDEYFGALELEDSQSVSLDYEENVLRTANFGYEERLLTHMYYRPNNRSGGCDRFYIYGMSSRIMLEVEHGRGVTLYKFR